MRALLLASLAAAATAAPHAAAPTPIELCAPFTSDGTSFDSVCSLELKEGVTYSVYTECESVKGSVELRLRDTDGVLVAFNDGYPFCPGSAGGEALLQFFVECGVYPPGAAFTLEQGCAGGVPTSCAGRVAVEESNKEPPVICPPRFACAPQNDAVACAALGELYAATAPSGWLNSSGWAAAAAGAPTDLCSFNGTSCDAKGALTSLNLRGNGLAGSLPDSLGDLISLTALNLAVNQIGGTVPASLARLTQLTQLWLVSNALVGTIPSALGALTELVTLRFDFNSMSGTIPNELGLMTRLTWLDIDAGKNSFSGTIPESFGNLKELNTLYLDGLQLTGTMPEAIGHLTVLEILEVDHNFLSGTVPASFASLTRLHDLGLNASGLCGPVPGHQPDDGPLPPC